MNFPAVNEEGCLSDIPGGGGSGGDVQSLVLKPGLLVGCVGMALTTNQNLLIVSGAGSADANGTYHKTSETSYTQEGGSHVILFIEGDNLWELYDPAAVVLYTIAPGDFPDGTWSVGSGDEPVPTVDYGSATQFRTFLKTDNSGETLIESGLFYESSNPEIVVIDSTTGQATLLTAGVVTISVTYGALSTYAQIQVVGEGDDCCDDTKIATLVVIDNSKSMGLDAFAGLRRLEIGKKLAHYMFSAMRWDKDVAGLMSFNVGTTMVQAIGSTQPTLATTWGIPLSTLMTDIEEMLDDALAALAAETADRKVLILFSDGENRPDADGSIPSSSSILNKATAFKNAGGIIVCVGCMASGDGFALLQSMASGGFFLNTPPINVGSLTGLLCYYCGGLPPSYGFCASDPLGEQTPASPLPDPELSDSALFISTKRVCVECEETQAERCATETRSSYVSQEEADTLATAAATAAATALCGESNNDETIQFNNGTNAPADPYPTSKLVSGESGLITKVTISLLGLKRTDGAPMGLLLVSPSGTAVLFAYVTADVVSRPFASVNLVIDDDAGSAIPFESSSGNIPAGTYQPTVLNSGDSNPLPLPAPQDVPYPTALAEFIGEDPNGEWQLYAYHRHFFSVFSPENYQIINGWDLTLTTA